MFRQEAAETGKFYELHVFDPLTLICRPIEYVKGKIPEGRDFYTENVCSYASWDKFFLVLPEYKAREGPIARAPEVREICILRMVDYSRFEWSSVELNRIPPSVEDITFTSASKLFVLSDLNYGNYPYKPELEFSTLSDYENEDNDGEYYGYLRKMKLKNNVGNVHKRYGIWNLRRFKLVVVDDDPYLVSSATFRRDINMYWKPETAISMLYDDGTA